MRPKIKRHVCPHSGSPYRFFKPNGIPTSELNQVSIAADELEAIRLVDLEGLAQQDAAKQMQVSRQTFANIIKQARRKITHALLNGEALALGEK